MLGGLGFGTSILGEIAKAYGQKQSGRDEQLANEMNAAVSRANASAIRTVGDFQVASLEKQKKRFRSTQHAGYAKAGVRSEGSPIDVMIDSAAEYEKDILISKYNTRVGEIQSTLAETMSNIEGKKAKKMGTAKMWGTLLSTTSNLASMGVGSFGGGAIKGGVGGRNTGLQSAGGGQGVHAYPTWSPR